MNDCAAVVVAVLNIKALEGHPAGYLLAPAKVMPESLEKGPATIFYSAARELVTTIPTTLMHLFRQTY
jgi:hypothetical protein